MYGVEIGEIALVLQNLERAAHGKQKFSPENTVAGVWPSITIIMELVPGRDAFASLDMKLN